VTRPSRHLRDLAAPGALLALALLAGCAETQKPAAGQAGEAATPAPPTPWEKDAAQAPAAPAAEGTPAPAPPAGPAARPKATPEAQQRARASFAEGVRLEAAGSLPAAAAAFDRAFADDPDLPWAGYDAGLVRERLGDDGRAAAAYQLTIEARPDFAPAAQNLARVWIRQGKRDEAERLLRARLARGEGVALHVGLAEVELAADKLDEAEAECRAALRSDEKNVPAMVLLATTYARKKRFELARMVLENARQVDPSDAAVWNRLGFVELALGNRAQAIEHFKTAAALRSDYPEAHVNYGAMLADADDFAGAEQELSLAVKYAPRSAGAWLDLGNAYRGLQRFDDAEKAYGKALELDPRLVEAQFDLALLYLDVEKPGLSTLQRLERGLAFFDAFEKQGGVEPRVAAYRKDAAREVDREKKRLAREEKDRVRKEAEARRKAEEEARHQAEAAAPPAAALPDPGAADAPKPAADAKAAPATATPPKAAGKPPPKPVAKPAAKPAAKAPAKAEAPKKTPPPDSNAGKLGQEGGDK
jgi:tetratricopeptide (TPR) repeat protein